MSADLNAYVGLPWRKPKPPDDEGFTCWSLVRLVYRDLLGVELPAWDTVPPTDRRAVASAAATEAKRWVGVTPSFERALDVVLLVDGGCASHCGVVTGHRAMLHCEIGRTAWVERYDGLRWGGYQHHGGKVVGFYRLG